MVDESLLKHKVPVLPKTNMKSEGQTTKKVVKYLYILPKRDGVATLVPNFSRAYRCQTEQEKNKTNTNPFFD